MDTKEHILDIAQRLIQRRGVNGFSYADIAKEVGVSKASLHHHFATKTDLVSRLLDRYSAQLSGYLDTLMSDKSAAMDRLEGYANLYRKTLDSERVCMGGILSAEAITLDERVHPQLAHFFDLQLKWLVRVIEAGRATGELTQSGTPAQDASAIIAALQGGLIVSRSAKSNAFFDQCAHGVIDRLRVH